VNVTALCLITGPTIDERLNNIYDIENMAERYNV
jgi:hypothetical protein